MPPAGDTLARNSIGQTEARASEVPQQGRSSFQVGAEILSRGMNTARGINERDFLTAGVEVLGGVAAATGDQADRAGTGHRPGRVTPRPGRPVWRSTSPLLTK